MKDIGIVSRSSREVFIEYKVFLKISFAFFFFCLFIVFVIFFCCFFFTQYVSLLASNGNFFVLIRSISKNFSVG